MRNLNKLVHEIVSSSNNPKTRPDMKNITLRLPLPTHGKLEAIQNLAGSSKTVVAEDILVTAIEDVYQQLLDNPDLEDYWRDRAIDQAERDEEDQLLAEQMAGV